jgi:ABC-type sugar transport system substrate-binding protein
MTGKHSNKRTFLLLISVILLITATACACTGGADGDTSKANDPNRKLIGFYADVSNAYNRQIKDVLERAAADDADAVINWQIDFKTGQGTTEESLKAVEGFIAAKCDAIVMIQNNPETTSRCIEQCKLAGIPYFGAVYDFSSVTGARDATGSIAYDSISGGYLAGQDALSRDVRKVINVESEDESYIAAQQLYGFLKAYEDAGRSLGGYTAEQIIAERPSVSRLDGTQTIEIVFWASGGQNAETAAGIMKEIIPYLGKNGFDAIYTHNNVMAEGVIAAMTDANLTADNYWIGSVNGNEISWDWAEDGLITMDVNQPAALEGILLYQQLKAYFSGEAFRAYLRPYFTPYTKEDIAEKRPSLIPATNIDAFMQGYKDGVFITDIDDPIFADIEAFREDGAEQPEQAE